MALGEEVQQGRAVLQCSAVPGVAGTLLHPLPRTGVAQF